MRYSLPQLANDKQSPDTAVFRQIVTWLETDTMLRNVLGDGRPAALRSWKGDPHDGFEFGLDQAPAIRLTPGFEAEEFWNPSEISGALLINVEMIVKGTCADDCMNLWYAIERAIYPLGQVNARVTALQGAGGKSGLVKFSQPAFDPQPGMGFFQAVGQMRVDVTKKINQ